MKVLLLLSFLCLVSARSTPQLLCIACNATLHEAARLVQQGLGRAGNRENAVTAAMDDVCNNGQNHFVTYAAPPLSMKKACFEILEIYEEQISNALYKKFTHAKAVKKICTDICQEAENAPEPEMADDIVKIDNVPIPLEKHGDGHFERKTPNDELR